MSKDTLEITIRRDDGAGEVILRLRIENTLAGMKNIYPLPDVMQLGKQERQCLAETLPILLRAIRKTLNVRPYIIRHRIKENIKRALQGMRPAYRVDKEDMEQYM